MTEPPRWPELAAGQPAVTLRGRSGARLAAGWRSAGGGQRFRVVLNVLCAMSVVAGLVVALAGVGTPRSLTQELRASPVRAAGANRAQAAAWIAQQVSPTVVVSCDPAMCRQLGKSGFPAARLMTLRPNAGNPLGSGVVVATPAVRNDFGARLATVYAPLVIAGFGTGAERVDVRAVAPGGPAAFKAQLVSEHAYQTAAGSQLLRNKRILVSPGVGAALLAGQVDPRVLAVLSVLAAEMPVRLLAFDDPSPGASSTVPLRGAEIGAPSPAVLSAMLAFLHAQQAPYRPAVAAVAHGPGGQSRVTVRFDAPALMDPDGP